MEDLLKFKEKIINEIDLNEIKIQKGVLERVWELTNNNYFLSQKIILFLANKFGNIITFKKCNNYLYLCKHQECDVIISKIINPNNNLNNFFKTSKFYQDSEFAFLSFSLIEATKRIINDLNIKKISNEIFQNVDVNNIICLKDSLEEIADKFTLDSENDYKLFIEAITNTKNNISKNFKKYTNTKVYEIFGDDIKYL